MTGFDVNKLSRFTASEIFCSSAGCMLVEASGDIDSDTGVKRVVGAEDDIDGPVHGRQAGCGAYVKLFSESENSGNRILDACPSPDGKGRREAN